ncbi:hypothetical protein [Halobacterium wangiae]|uniref:hypothetical protein n=1 Tax=Halobacterium wangiae TaxID=2902623 RepID=UPI001E297EC3|nr:hypothetical protein [Halobacterium wangiae]
MMSILHGRVDVGLRPDLVEDDVLAHIADLAAGDARAGIALLRNAAERASARASGLSRLGLSTR